jgi:hypothetical protein
MKVQILLGAGEMGKNAPCPSVCCFTILFQLFSTIMRSHLLLLVVLLTSIIAARGQAIIVVNDPTVKAPETKMTSAEEAIFKEQAVPAVRKAISSDTCQESVDVAGVAHGSFTRAGAKQSLVFYQYCQTGNAFGQVGLVLIENNKLIGNYISDSGWSTDIEPVPDIDQNGLDEFVLGFSGGMHQGQGGIGVDIMEFSNGIPKGIGWYKAEEYAETQATTVWKLTAKPGMTPVFYQQKYDSTENDKWRRVGVNTILKLGKPISTFTAVK